MKFSTALTATITLTLSTSISTSTSTSSSTLTTVPKATASSALGTTHCANPTQDQGCFGNLIQIKSSSNASYIGLYGYVLPAAHDDNHIGQTLSLTSNLAEANTFAITTDIYGEVFLNATESARYAFWNPQTQIGGSDNSAYYAWPVNFLAPLYGSTRITPTFENQTRALTLDIKEYGSHGSLIAEANLSLICANGTASPYIIVSNKVIEGCVGATLVWV